MLAVAVHIEVLRLKLQEPPYQGPEALHRLLLWQRQRKVTKNVKGVLVKKVKRRKKKNDRQLLNTNQSIRGHVVHPNLIDIPQRNIVEDIITLRLAVAGLQVDIQNAIEADEGNTVEGKVHAGVEENTRDFTGWQTIHISEYTGSPLLITGNLVAWTRGGIGWTVQYSNNDGISHGYGRRTQWSRSPF